MAARLRDRPPRPACLPPRTAPRRRQPTFSEPANAPYPAEPIPMTARRSQPARLKVRRRAPDNRAPFRSWPDIHHRADPSADTFRRRPRDENSPSKYRVEPRASLATGYTDYCRLRIGPRKWVRAPALCAKRCARIVRYESNGKSTPLPRHGTARVNRETIVDRPSPCPIAPANPRFPLGEVQLWRKERDRAPAYLEEE